MSKGIIDLIPAAVEAVKQETQKKMTLFSSTGKAGTEVKSRQTSSTDISQIVEMVLEEIKRTRRI